MKPRQYIILFLFMMALVFVSICFAIYLVFFRPMGRVVDAIHASQRAMVLPENYRPAGRIMARLCQSDPKLLAMDPDGAPPNWTPPELGKFGAHYIIVQGDEAGVSVRGGFIDGLGYVRTRDRDRSDSANC